MSKKKSTSKGVHSKNEKSKLNAQERQLEKARLREEQLALQAQKREELMVLEQLLREERLKPTCAMLSELSRKKFEHDLKYRDELDWKHRIQCDGTPNPLIVQEVNTYLFFWRQVCHANFDRNSYVEKCLEIFKIISAVDDIVDLPLDFSQYKINCFRQARDNLGRLLVEIVYSACYHLISDYDRRMVPVDLEATEYRNLCDAFAVGIHVVCYRPRLKTDDRPSPICDFPECLVMVNVPPQLSQEYIAIMALWLRWDPFTDRMLEFDVSKSLDFDTRDLWQYSADIWVERNQILQDLTEEKERLEKELWVTKMEEKLKLFKDVTQDQYPEDLKVYIDELKGKNKKKNVSEYILDEEEQEPEEIKDIVKKKNDSQKLLEVNPSKSIRIELRKTPGQELEERQIKRMKKMYDSFKYPEKPDELNPRRYWILGGAFNVDIWKIPEQPVEYQDGTVGIMVIGPSSPQPIDYHEEYVPLQTSMEILPGSSENEETDVKKQNQEELKRLTIIYIKLPENVLWFENPKPVIWDENRKLWMTDYIHDVNFNEEKQTVSFRTGKMGTYGLAVNRYTNFPFRSWEVRAVSGGVVLSITAATVLVVFVVQDDKAAVVQLQNVPTVVLQDLIGVYHRPNKLVRLLCRSGINLFPEPDAQQYVAGNRPPKHTVFERHTYRCMAVLSGTHRFLASRWNVLAPFDQIVFQMKEIPNGEPNGILSGEVGGELVFEAGSIPTDETRRIPTSETGNSDEISGGSVLDVPYKTVMVTRERAVVLKCNEDSEVFSEEPQPSEAKDSFAPDLYTLATYLASNDGVREAMANEVDFKTVETLFYLMEKIKFLSYS